MKNNYLLPLIALLLVVGCSTPKSGRTVEKSGFLDHYAQLKPTEKRKEAQLLYINPATDFSTYTKIFMEPVGVWTTERSKLSRCSEEDLQALVNYLDATLRDSLKPDYTLVNEAGPDVMTLRVAITDGKKGKIFLNTFSSIMPPALAISYIKLAVSGTHTAVGEASVEAELVDSISGERLIAAVDARAGRKSLASGNFEKWDDTKDAYDYWAKRTQMRLTELRTKP